MISLLSKGLSRVSSNTTVRKHQFFSAPAFFMVQLSHFYMTTGKNYSLILSKWLLVFFNPPFPDQLNPILSLSKCKRNIFSTGVLITHLLHLTVTLGKRIRSSAPSQGRCWRILRVPWTARRSNQLILKEISPEYSLEGQRLKVKLTYFGHLM